MDPNQLFTGQIGSFGGLSMHVAPPFNPKPGDCYYDTATQQMHVYTQIAQSTGQPVLMAVQLAPAAQGLKSFGSAAHKAAQSVMGFRPFFDQEWTIVPVEHHRIVLNRAVCDDCHDEVISPSDDPLIPYFCACRNLGIAGGQRKLQRQSETDNWHDTSIVTRTYIRLGVANVEAYQASIEIWTKHLRPGCWKDTPGGGRQITHTEGVDNYIESKAEVGDMVVYEPDNTGASAWKMPAFWAWHEVVPVE